jgi:subtilisin-like proprotein convertase family protein
MGGVRALACAVALVAASFDAGAFDYAAIGTGPIPDGAGGSGGDPVCNESTQGQALTLQFAVRGLRDPVHHVGVRITFQPAHTYAGDLHVRLAAPGGSPSAPIFGDTGSSEAGDDGSDALGHYEFADDAPLDWWSGASMTVDDEPIPAGFYRASQDGSGEAVALDAVFGDLPPERANGTWTLDITDDCAQDTGGVGSAALVINSSLPVELQAFSVD